MKTIVLNLLLLASLVLPGLANSALPTTEKGVTTIHLDQYGGYFSAKETLASLKTGKYKFVISNKTNKLVGFLLQDYKTHEQLDMFPIEPGKTKETIVNVTENGFRYRCPINPTPWYDVENVSVK